MIIHQPINGVKYLTPFIGILVSISIDNKLTFFTEWGIFSRSAFNFHGVQQLGNSAIKQNAKTASADETKTSTNAEKALFTGF